MSGDRSLGTCVPSSEVTRHAPVFRWDCAVCSDQDHLRHACLGGWINARACLSNFHMSQSDREDQMPFYRGFVGRAPRMLSESFNSDHRMPAPRGRMRPAKHHPALALARPRSHSQSDRRFFATTRHTWATISIGAPLFHWAESLTFSSPPPPSSSKPGYCSLRVVCVVRRSATVHSGRSTFSFQRRERNESRMGSFRAV